MKIVYRTSDYPDVLIKTGLLEEAGFFVHVDNLNAVGSMPELGFTVGYSIMVPDEQVEPARLYVREMEDEVSSIVPENDEGPNVPEQTDNIDTCPNCGHWEVVRHRSILWLPVFWLLGVMIPSYGGRHRKCLKCGHAYRLEGSDLNPLIKALVLFVIVTWLLVAFAPEGGNWRPSSELITH